MPKAKRKRVSNLTSFHKKSKPPCSTSLYESQHVTIYQPICLEDTFQWISSSGLKIQLTSDRKIFVSKGVVTLRNEMIAIAVDETRCTFLDYKQKRITTLDPNCVYRLSKDGIYARVCISSQ
jgi:hypothetical protein